MELEIVDRCIDVEIARIKKGNFNDVKAHYLRVFNANQNKSLAIVRIYQFAHI